MTSKITAKGQVTIPKHVRDSMGLKAGDEIEFVQEDGSFILRRHFNREAYEKALDKWAGYAKHLKGKRSDDLVAEMRDG